MFPSALKTASLFANIFKILSSHKTKRLESLVCSFCIVPYVGLTSLVIVSAVKN